MSKLGSKSRWFFLSHTEVLACCRDLKRLAILVYYTVISSHKQSSLQFCGYSFFVIFFRLEQMVDGVTQYVTHTAYLPGT